MKPSGFSLLEALVSISIVGAMIVAFGSLLAVSSLHKRTRATVMATALAEEVLEAVRDLPSSELANRVSGPPIGITLNRGRWDVAATSTAPTSPNALRIRTAEAASAGTTSILLLPADARGDGSVKAAVMAPAGSPAGWRVGVGIRGRDIENLYRYTVGASSVTFERVRNGAATTLWSQTQTHQPGTWYTLEVAASGGSFSLKRNGATLATVADSTFAYGDATLLAQGSALGWFDDVGAAGMSDESFDDESAGALPPGWRRLSPFDLPSGSAELTIEDAFGGEALKKITARVRWEGPRGPETLSVATYRK